MLSKMFTIVIILVGLVTVYFYVLALWTKNGQAPSLEAGKLLACGSKPNCICSEPHNNHGVVEPIAYPYEAIDLEHLKLGLNAIGATVMAESENYIWAIVKSSLFGFTDDVELRVDPVGKVIQIRSASRAGYSDLGMNLKRANAFRQWLADNPPVPTEQ